MILSLVAAVYLALPRNTPGELLVMLLVTIFGAMLIVVPLLQRMSPVRALLADPPHDPVAHTAALERALASSHFDTIDVYARGRYTLMLLYKRQQRYEDAIREGRLLVQMRHLTHAFETEVHLEIAECLDALGRDDEAEAERDTADATLDGQPEDALGWLAQGELLEGQTRYGDAAEAYARALELYPADPHVVRHMLLSRLAVASARAGLPEQAVAWAEQLLESSTSGHAAITAHRVAAGACADLGRLSEAESHARRAYELAREHGDPNETAACLAAVGLVEFRRGELAAAEATALRAEALAPGSSNAPLLLHATILRTQGRLSEAVDCIERAHQIGPPGSGNPGRWVRAILRATATLYKGELGRVEEAWGDHGTVERELAGDPRFGVLVLAQRAWLQALRGERRDSLEVAEEALARLEQARADPAVYRDCLDVIGRGLCEIGEYDRAAQCWGQVLAGMHSPVAAPAYWYMLGDCRARSGDLDGARESFAHAVATGIESQHARLARERLAALDVAPNAEACQAKSATDPATSP